MKSKLVNYLKWIRLLVACLMLLVTPYSVYMKKINVAIADKLIMSALVAFFVFFLGLEYHMKDQQKNLSFFLMLFSVMMLIGVIAGLIY